MKDLTGVIVGAVVVIVVIIGALWYQQNKESDTTGTLFIGITDAAAEMAGVTDIDLKVKKVEVYNETQGWVTVSSANKTYSLLSLKNSGKTELYAEEKVATGSYDHVRVTIDDAVVKTTAQGSMSATLPTNEITISSAVNVRAGNNSYVKIDFLADKSLHMTTDKKYVFAPVVAVESRSNTQVTVADDDSVTVSGGSVDSSLTVGVDLDGSSKNNFQLNTDAGLTVDSPLLGEVKFMLSGKTYSQNATSSVTATSSVNASTKVNSDDTSVGGGININLN